MAKTHRPYLLFALALLLGLTAPICAHATPLISGVLFNPEGADSGNEWVEIHNPSATYNGMCSLDFGNGATPDDWDEIWSGTIDMPGDSYLLFSPQGDIPTSLSLQNGPDALRLTCDNDVDTVGWGEHEHPMYYEGSPFIGSSEGEALSRRFELIGDNVFIVDTNNNSADFESLVRAPHRQDEHRISIHLEVLNAQPAITHVENCTDAMPTSRLQAIPGTAMICDVAIHDGNGLDDIVMLRMELHDDNILASQELDLANLNHYPQNTTSATIPVMLMIPGNVSDGSHTIRFILSDGESESMTEISIEILSVIGATLSPSSLAWDLHPGEQGEPRDIVITNTGTSELVLTIADGMPILDFTVTWDLPGGSHDTGSWSSPVLSSDADMTATLVPLLKEGIRAQEITGELTINVESAHDGD